MTTGAGKANRLIHETSPYLLQHAHNPVDWYPWGEEAFRRAREEDRPIFLSVGYSSCHWCHVMERESFEDQEVAQLLNEGFVPVKVDREERPDVDAIYMQAVQMMTRQGGWPMSVFLTPDLKPFFGGTYFPPESRYGRPGFKEILRQLAQLWKSERDKVLEVAGNLVQGLRAEEVPEGAEPARGETVPDLHVVELAFEYANRSFDRDYGGFGGAPKFPRSVDLSLLLLHHHATGERRALEMVEQTLIRMAEGGMYDQIGGGFHRYSTDERWLVPHFEKMLYDNALLARTYLEGYQATAKPLYLRVAQETLDYVLREMTSPEGGFYSATDADSEGEEGKFFVWTPDEVEAALGIERARLLCLYYGITVGGNFEGKSIPHRARSLEEVARGLKVEPGALEKVLAEGREILYREREKREKPFRDEKVITSWNGLMISALARGYAVTGEERYREGAARAAALVREKLQDDGQLLRIYKDGRASIPGYLDDFSYLIEGFLDLYQATFDPAHLREARRLADRMLGDFWDAREGGFFYTAPYHQDLIARRKDPFDGATPAASGVAALDLLRLERLTGESGYRERARALLAGLKRAIEEVPMGFGYTLMALDAYHRPAAEIAVVGGAGSTRTEEVLRAIERRFIPRLVLAGATGRVSPELAREIPLLEGKEALGGKTTVYICRDFACQAPVQRSEELEERLSELARPLRG
jgi:uncharacterized protein YyaL (SSP411 family)